MKKLYNIRIMTFAVVAADDESSACDQARWEAEEIVTNDRDAFECVGEIKSDDDLPLGWDAHCLPHGTDDDREIADYLR